MFDNIVQRFLDRQKQIMPQFSRERISRQSRRNVQPAADGGALKKILAVSRQVSAQLIEGLIPWIDRPYYFINCLGQFTGQTANSLCVQLCVAVSARVT